MLYRVFHWQKLSPPCEGAVKHLFDGDTEQDWAIYIEDDILSLFNFIKAHKNKVMIWVGDDNTSTIFISKNGGFNQS